MNDESNIGTSTSAEAQGATQAAAETLREAAEGSTASAPAGDTDTNSIDAAESADGSVADGLRRKVATLEAELESAHEKAHAALRRVELQRLLIRERATDVLASVEAAIVCIESGAAKDAASAVRELKRRRPGMFPSQRGASAMSVVEIGPAAGIADAARAAARSGDRAALLRYLRVRRQHT